MAALEAAALSKEMGVPQAPHDPEVAQAIEAWNIMGGQIDWAALEVVAALLSAADIELLLARLLAIREYATAKH